MAAEFTEEYYQKILDAKFVGIRSVLPCWLRLITRFDAPRVEFMLELGMMARSVLDPGGKDTWGPKMQSYFTIDMLMDPSFDRELVEILREELFRELFRHETEEWLFHGTGAENTQCPHGGKGVADEQDEP